MLKDTVVRPDNLESIAWIIRALSLKGCSCVVVLPEDSADVARGKAKKLLHDGLLLSKK